MEKASPASPLDFLSGPSPGDLWILYHAGEEEAKAGGKLLKEEGIKFDKAYTSYLRRAIKTCWLVLEQVDYHNTPTGACPAYLGGCALGKDVMGLPSPPLLPSPCALALLQMEQMYIPIVPAWQLNERHYGALSVGALPRLSSRGSVQVAGVRLMLTRAWLLGWWWLVNDRGWISRRRWTSMERTRSSFGGGATARPHLTASWKGRSFIQSITQQGCGVPAGDKRRILRGPHVTLMLSGYARVCLPLTAHVP